jgi:hypothetical protein
MVAVITAPPPSGLLPLAMQAKATYDDDAVRRPSTAVGRACYTVGALAPSAGGAESLP